MLPHPESLAAKHLAPLAESEVGGPDLPEGLPASLQQPLGKNPPGSKEHSLTTSVWERALALKSEVLE